MKEIPLTQGLVALVDDEDYAELSQHRWCAMHLKPDAVYAGRMIPTPEGPRRQRQVAMHRVLLGGPASHIDHIDGNGLNNQRANLRPATLAQNQYNKRSLGGRSAFKGVHWQQGAWVARISKNGVRLHLGRFPTEVEAALAYDQAAREHHGEFARLNNPLGTDHR